MNGFVRWIKNHGLTLICSLLIVLLLAGSFTYVMWLTNRNTELDVFRHVCEKINAVALDIGVLSEYEIEHRDPGDTGKCDILPEGDIQEVRDKVFATLISSGHTYRSDAVDGCGAYYTYDADGNYPACIIRYEKGTAERWLDGTDYCCLIGDSICITRNDANS